LTPAVEMPRRTTGVICTLVNIHVTILSRIESYLRTTKRTQSQIKAQAQAKDKFRDQKAHSCGGDNLSDDATSANDDTKGDRSFATDHVCNLATNEAAKELPDGTDVVESRLPFCRKDVLAIRDISKIPTE
jgi:hypothetical protein